LQPGGVVNAVQGRKHIVGNRTGDGSLLFGSDSKPGGNRIFGPILPGLAAVPGTQTRFLCGLRTTIQVPEAKRKGQNVEGLAEYIAKQVAGILFGSAAGTRDSDRTNHLSCDLAGKNPHSTRLNRRCFFFSAVFQAKAHHDLVSIDKPKGGIQGTDAPLKARLPAASLSSLMPILRVDRRSAKRWLFARLFSSIVFP